MKRIYLTEEQISSIISLYESGLSYVRIQEKLGIDANKVKRTLKEINHPLRPHKVGDEIRRGFSEEEIKQAIELYNAGTGITGICKIIKCSPVPLREALRERGLQIRDVEESHAFQRFPIKEDYFDAIDSQDKAYILGLLFADGNNYIGKVKPTYSVHITLKADDIELLERIREKMGIARKIKIYTRSSDGRTYARLEFKNKHISLRLNDLGVVPAKTFITTFPDYLSDELIPHFIRGLMDGDGCIPRNLKTVSFAGSHEMMRGLVSKFEKHLGFTAHIVKIKHSPGISTVSIGRGEYKIKLLHWLYDNSDLKLERKYKLALQILEKYESKLVG